MCDMTDFICSTWLRVWRDSRDMTHSYVCHDPSICVPWLIYMCAMTHSHVCHLHVCHDSFTCVPWLIHMCAMTQSVTWLTRHDSLICVPWLIHMCAMTHSHVWHDWFRCVTWHIHTGDINNSRVHWFIYYTTHLCVTCRIHMWHDSFMRVYNVTRSYVWRDTFICEMIIHMWRDVLLSDVTHY